MNDFLKLLFILACVLHFVANYSEIKRGLSLMICDAFCTE